VAKPITRGTGGVTVHHVSKRFNGDAAAVDDVDFDIPQGAFVTLLGPSGSGKTTTLRMIAGLETPTSGEITIGGQRVFGQGINVPTHRRKIGMVFQSYAVWPHMTAFKNVAFPLEIRGDRAGETRRAVQEMIALVGLQGLEGRLPAELSGGQQQRLALARALIARPDVLLFDEPLSNLDAKLRESMRTLIKDVHRRLGLTAVYVTHDQLEAIWLSDTIHVMRDGRLVQSGTPEEIYSRPADLFVAEFIGQGNVLPVQSSDAANGTVRTAFGALLKVAAWQGARAPSHVLIRFNNVRIHPATDVTAGRDNVMPGRLSAIQFIGDRFHLEAVVADGFRITAYAENVAHLAPHVGRDVAVELPVECLNALGQ
jgi:iron(III) transport system ATP-binding protein